MLAHEGRQVLAPAFLLAFEHQRNADGQRTGGFLPGAAGLDEGQHLALVVGRAARHDDLAPIPLDNLRIEGIGLPEIERIDRLHVIMGVEQHMRAGLCGAMGDNHRMAGRGAGRGIKAQSGQLAGYPFGRLAAFGGIGRVGRDGLDTQKVKQTLQTLLQARIDLGKDGVESGGIGHGKVPG
jgi:hypothetical protein